MASASQQHSASTRRRRRMIATASAGCAAGVTTPGNPRYNVIIAGVPAAVIAGRCSRRNSNHVRQLLQRRQPQHRVHDVAANVGTVLAALNAVAPTRTRGPIWPPRSRPACTKPADSKRVIAKPQLLDMGNLALAGLGKVRLIDARARCAGSGRRRRAAPRTYGSGAFEALPETFAIATTQAVEFMDARPTSWNRPAKPSDDEPRLRIVLKLRQHLSLRCRLHDDARAALSTSAAGRRCPVLLRLQRSPQPTHVPVRSTTGTRACRAASTSALGNRRTAPPGASSDL